MYTDMYMTINIHIYIHIYVYAFIYLCYTYIYIYTCILYWRVADFLTGACHSAGPKEVSVALLRAPARRAAPRLAMEPWNPRVGAQKTDSMLYLESQWLIIMG